MPLISTLRWCLIAARVCRTGSVWVCRTGQDRTQLLEWLIGLYPLTTARLCTASDLSPEVFVKHGQQHLLQTCPLKCSSSTGSSTCCSGSSPSSTWTWLPTPHAVRGGGGVTSGATFEEPVGQKAASAGCSDGASGVGGAVCESGRDIRAVLAVLTVLFGRRRAAQLRVGYRSCYYGKCSMRVMGRGSSGVCRCSCKRSHRSWAADDKRCVEGAQ